MSPRFFNSLTRHVEDFVPLDPAGSSVGMYCCGPTVHDFAHIGNFRTFVFCDLVRRLLEFRGYHVRHVMNVTDVEDKIIDRVRKAGVRLEDYTRGFELAFLQDLDSLGCKRPHVIPRATESMPEMIDLIQRLVDRGIAYRAPDGSVYFSIEKYRLQGGRYGQLAHLDFEHMRPGERIQSDDYSKEAIADFALWKARTPEDGEVFWPSPWGEGRPGWHIECSAMSMKNLGPSFDLHLGGEDLIFPHHEDEIAQSEGAGLQVPGQPFVRTWLHAAHLLVEGRKMSKSLGNYFTLRDLIAKGFSGREVRFLLVSAHYRETFNFTLDGLHGARSALSRLDECLARLTDLAGHTSAHADPALLDNWTQPLDDDLNVSAAWGRVFDWVRDMNRKSSDPAFSRANAAASLAAWHRFNLIMGIPELAEPAPPPEIQSLLEARQSARKSRDFSRADSIRAELLEKGWVVEDTPKGPRLKTATPNP